MSCIGNRLSSAMRIETAALRKTSLLQLKEMGQALFITLYLELMGVLLRKEIFPFFSCTSHIPLHRSCFFPVCTCSRTWCPAALGAPFSAGQTGGGAGLLLMIVTTETWHLPNSSSWGCCILLWSCPSLKLVISYQVPLCWVRETCGWHCALTFGATTKYWR